MLLQIQPRSTACFLLVSLVVEVFSGSSRPPTSSTQEMVALGSSKLTELSLAVKRPRYGDCWARALAALETVCQELQEENHSRLALQFANCQLAQSGQATFPCPADQSLSSCLESVDSIGWTSYTSFYSHTHNMCYFIQSQLWQVREGCTDRPVISGHNPRRRQTRPSTNCRNHQLRPWRGWRSPSSCSRR